MEILRQTIETTQSIAKAMAAVVAYWEGRCPDWMRPYGCKAEVDTIEQDFPVLAAKLDEARDYIGEHWNEIIVNDILESELKEFLDAMKAFEKKARQFDDEYLAHEASALTMFQDMWIARMYLVLMIRQKRDYAEILRKADDYLFVETSAARPFRGMAREFRRWFVGVTDSDLEKLILFHIPLPVQAKWLKNRNTAVIFAKAFGLTAAEMNESFIFPGKRTPHRDLNLTNDAPSKPMQTYPIWDSIQLFKHCRP